MYCKMMDTLASCTRFKSSHFGCQDRDLVRAGLSGLLLVLQSGIDALGSDWILSTTVFQQIG